MSKTVCICMDVPGLRHLDQDGHLPYCPESETQIPPYDAGWIAVAVEKIAKLTQPQRARVMSSLLNRFCPYCGRDCGGNGPCQCENDD